jgi:hypothetical protein
MPYNIYKTDGTKLTTVGDASLDTTTDLALLGKNYSGYGQVVNDNFVKLLENFSNKTAPAKPIKGQLWYDTVNKMLKVSHDGKTFKGLANIFVQSSEPGYQSLTRGDLWWDSSETQLKAFDGSTFQVIGPISPAASVARWIPGEETGETSAIVPVLKAEVARNVVSIVSDQNLSLSTGNFPIIKKGITLYGADRNTGSTTSTGYYFWGTAAESLTAVTATYALTALSLSKGGADKLLSNGTGSTYISASTSSVATTIAQRDASADLWANVFHGIATSARYADLAERYASDTTYDVGTVLVIGGEKEVTVTNERANTAVVGIVSARPAYMMNSEAGPDSTHPFVALRGRVPCKVAGPVKRGDLLVTSIYAGYAAAATDNDHPSAVVAKALEDNNKSLGIIEVLVV